MVLVPGLATIDISILRAVYDFEAPKEGLTQAKADELLKLRDKKVQGPTFSNCRGARGRMRHK